MLLLMLLLNPETTVDVGTCQSAHLSPGCCLQDCYARGSGCYCDEECLSHGDCCSDVSAESISQCSSTGE